jgi:response regulator RpfG family c-di-GMP phosphodiesterase
MTDKHENKLESKNNLVFADETPDKKIDINLQPPWKILISDDDQEVHDITKLVLEDYEFDNRELVILSAYTGEETNQIIRKNPDIAIILLDVVMETENAGLDVVRFIREELKNHFVRIILRTGQPGMAPERTVVMKYDINDYKEKTELTAQKLYTAITASLRAFRDIKIIDRNRRGLELIVSSSEQLFTSQRIKTFSEDVLTQLISLLHLDEAPNTSEVSAFAASHEDEQFKIITAIGTFKNFVNSNANDCLSPKIFFLLKKAMEEKSSIFIEDVFVGYFQTDQRFINLLYLEGCRNLSYQDKNLIRIFSTNVGVAFDNISLNREIIDTQKEIIETLGGIVETRSKETANHVLRVSEYSYLLAFKIGLSEKEASLLRLSAPMHDVGKIGIPDAILNKPSSLTSKEYELIKSHTTIGYDILKNSKRKILQTASIVALQHHEYWDGSGYPAGLKETEIHIFSRITGLADVFDAVSCKRTYKKTWPQDKVYQFILEQKSRQFDPDLVDVFLKDIHEFIAIKEKFADEYL